MAAMETKIPPSINCIHGKGTGESNEHLVSCNDVPDRYWTCDFGFIEKPNLFRAGFMRT